MFGHHIKALAVYFVDFMVAFTILKKLVELVAEVPMWVPMYIPELAEAGDAKHFLKLQFKFGDGGGRLACSSPATTTAPAPISRQFSQSMHHSQCV